MQTHCHVHNDVSDTIVKQGKMKSVVRCTGKGGCIKEVGSGMYSLGEYFEMDVLSSELWRA